MLHRVCVCVCVCAAVNRGDLLRLVPTRECVYVHCKLCVYVCVCVWRGVNGGQHTGYGVLRVCYVHSAACTSMLRVLRDRTLAAAAYPFKRLAMSMRHHTKVLANGKG